MPIPELCRYAALLPETSASASPKLRPYFWRSVGQRGDTGEVGLDTLMGVLGAVAMHCIVGLCPRSPLRHRAPNGLSSPPALGPFIFGESGGLFAAKPSRVAFARFPLPPTSG
jgi:hypothetical protein